MQDCDICRGRGIITTDDGKNKSCICAIRKQLSIFLKPIIQYETRKDIDFTLLNKDIIIRMTDGDLNSFMSIVKSFMIYTFLNKEKDCNIDYRVNSSYEIIEMYLSGDQIHQDLYNIPILFIDLTSYYNNKAMGDFILNIIKTRVNKKLRTWVYTGSLSNIKIKEDYSDELLSELLNYSCKSLKKFSERGSK